MSLPLAQFMEDNNNVIFIFMGSLLFNNCTQPKIIEVILLLTQGVMSTRWQVRKSQPSFLYRNTNLPIIYRPQYLYERPKFQVRSLSIPTWVRNWNSCTGIGKEEFHFAHSSTSPKLTQLSAERDHLCPWRMGGRWTETELSDCPVSPIFQCVAWEASFYLAAHTVLRKVT